MQILDNIIKERWDNFLGEQKQSQFLQSWEWGGLAEKENAEVLRVGVEDDGNGEPIVAAALIKKKVLGFSYWFCPCGPVISKKVEVAKATEYLFDEIEKKAKNENVIFLRFEPRFEIRSREFGTKFKIVRSIDIEPSKTSIVNLQKTEDELLRIMHQKTRYNIRLAEKKGVKIREASDEDFESFWRIMKETVDRDGFRLHSKEHYQKMLALDNNFVKLFLAEYDGKIIAAVLAAFFGDTITYVHGASANEFRNVMSPYLLHWHIMKLGKTLGYKYYDLNGVDENKWPGVTRFKVGFGGIVINYPGTFDLVFNKTWYNVYKVLRILWRRLEKIF